MTTPPTDSTDGLLGKLLPSSISDIRLNSPTLNLIVIVLGVAAAYFVTLQSLKVELAAKAESAVVAALDRKLARFEILLEQSVVNKDQFYRFARDTENRLIRIEHHLTANPGDSLGQR